MLLSRGIRKRCPQCGVGELFSTWNTLKENCSECNCVLQGREANSWFFIYMTTAFVTGLFLLYMFLFPTKNQMLGRLILTPLAIICIVFTLPYRKGIAVALDYFMEQQEKK